MLDNWVPRPPSNRPSAIAPVAAEVETKELKEVQKEAERAIEKAKAKKSGTKYESFGRKYFDDPVAFAKNCIFWEEGQGLTSYQEEILAAIPEKERVAVVGCHGLGKSATCAIAILWYALTREAVKEDWKCVVTASVNTQLSRYLWPEIKIWSRSLNWDKIGRSPFSTRNELLMSAIQLNYGQAFCVTPDEPQKAEGAHSPNLFYAIDEAKIVPGAIWDAMEGAFSGAGPDTQNKAYAFVISTPGPPVGRFYDVHSRKPGYESWWCKHVKVEDVIAAGRVSQRWVDEKRIQWGDSSVFKQKVLGLFASDDEDAVIPFEWVQRAMDLYDAET